MKKMFLLSSLVAFNMLYANPVEGGVLVFGRSGDSSTLDPSKATDGESFYGTTQVYDTLVQFKLGSTEIEPALAKSYEVSEDGLTYTFHLREGVYFAPTKYFQERVEMTADDVVFSLKRQFDKNHPYNKVNGPHDYWSAMDMDNIVKDVEKVDKYTVKITLKKKEAPFLANMAMDFASILCEKYANELLAKNKASDITRYPVGTGPFVFVEWKKDDRMIFVANKDYWGGKPHLDRLIIRVIPNPSVRAAELKAGQIQVMDFPNPAELKELEKNPNIKVLKKEGMNVGYMAMNQKRAEFKNPLVRQAINHAINKKAIVDAIYEGLGSVAHSPIPPSMWSYTNDITKYEYNPTLAKELLAKAGYPNGFKTNMWVLPVSRAYMPDGKRVAEVVQADLAKIGIEAKITTYDYTTYLEKTKNLEHDLAFSGWIGDNGDPDNFLYTLLSKAAANLPANNYSAWENDEFNNLITKAKETSNHEERVKLYEEAQKVFAKDAPWVTIANAVNVVPMLNKVQGFEIDPVGKRRFNKVWIEK